MENELRIVSAAISDRGLSEKRPQNEDSFLEMDQCGIFAVADGVGGAQAGEVASQMAVELLGEAFINLSHGSDAETVMRSAISQANAAIHQMAFELPQLASMATTIVALHLAGDIATIGHVGDSRLYRVDADGNLFRETDDHSMVADEVRAGRMTEEQAENHPSRNIISRALGAESVVEPDLKTIMVDPGTTFLLCSDGITRHVTDAEIKGVLTFGRAPADICQYLKDLCFERGAEDNLTAVVVRVGTAGTPVPVRHEIEAETGDILDVEEATIATARSPFETKATDEDDELLELETGELKVPETKIDLEPIHESDDVTIPIIEASTEFGPQDDAAPVQEPETVETSLLTEDDPVTETYDTSATTSQTISIFGDSGTESDTSEERSSFASLLTSFGILILGAAIGLGVYHFALAPKTVQQPSPQLSEMKSTNIPLSAFEENRRNVDRDPAGYLAKFAAAPQDCEDYYLLGRAYVLTGEHAKAKTALVEARNKLPQADPVNAKTLAADIAFALAISDDPAGQNTLKRELESSSSPSANANR